MDSPDFTYRITLSSVLMTAIIFGNVLVMVAYKANFRLRTPTYTFLVSLAFSDFLVGSVSLPFWIYGSVVNWEVDLTVYMIFISLDICSALASSFHLMAISAERFMAVSRPFDYQSVPARCYGFALAACWSLAVVMAGIWPVTRIYRNHLGFDMLRVYTSFMFSVGFFLPFLVITSTNVGVFRVVRRLVLNEPGQQGNLRKERKTAITLVFVTTLFFIAWTPFFVVNMIAMHCLPCLPPPPGVYVLMDFIKWFHFSNSAMNPLVYAFRDREVKRTFKKLLCACKRSSEVFPQSTLRSVSNAAISKSSFGITGADLYGNESHADTINMKQLYA